jgi:hypothetical protein
MPANPTDPTDQARSHLKTLFKPEFHKYIDTELAGDFAFHLSNVLQSANAEIARIKQVIVQLETSLLHGVSDKELLALLNTKPVPDFEICPNCDSPLPEGCLGLFKSDGDYCRYKETEKA